MSPRIAAECQRSVTPVFGADSGVIPTDRRREVEASTQAGSRVADATTMATRLGHEYRQSALLVASLVAPVALLLLLRRIPGIDPELHSEYFHLFVVSGIAACALAVAVMAAVAAVRLRRTGVVLLAAGGLFVGVCMLVHGLVTPGVFGRPFGYWVSRAPFLAIAGFALCQGAATLSPNPRVASVVGRHPVAILGGVFAVLVTFATIVVIDPTALHGATPFAHEEGIGMIVAAVAALILLPTAWQHWRRYRLGRDRLQLVLALAATMSIGAITAMQYGVLWHVSWWDYHVYLLGGFSAVAVVVFLRSRSAQTVDTVLVTALSADPLEHIAADYPAELRALVRRVEQKDAYTHGHSFRTAELATALGARLGLPPEDLRDLAQGAYLHDVGKIAIPDEILNKPGRLDPDERAVIESHAPVGADMVAQAPSLQGCVEIVRYHHERFDGAGYPDGVHGVAIPFLARVTAVADVWDALTSDRAYRSGWPPQKALAHIVAGRGSHFDPQVVEALVELAAEWGYRVGTSGDADEAWRAGQDCHDAGDARVPVLSGRA
jgi:putative nucleotidyltransferase with HDIG domain